MSGDMRLIHYSDKHLEAVHSVSQGEGRAFRRGDKPNGLWVSVQGEDDWKSWCEGEGFALDGLTHPTEVVLRDDAKVLRVQGPDQLKAFNDEYNDVVKTRQRQLDTIDWSRVAHRYDGIIIAPYVCSLRLDMDFSWYYGWDCASGAIWHSVAVSHLIPLPVEPVHPQLHWSCQREGEPRSPLSRGIMAQTPRAGGLTDDGS